MPTGEEDGRFVPVDFDPPTRMDHPRFRLRPLGPEHNDRDHTAWMDSVEHIQATPGFTDEWFSEPISLEENLADLERHRRDFENRAGFTYTVLDPSGPADRAQVIGCVYLYPDDDADFDVEVQSWVRADRADLDALLAATVRAWLEEAWPWPAGRIRHHPRPPVS